VDTTPVLRELLTLLNDISDSGEAMPVVVTKQIVFCNELMAKDGLSLLQGLKDNSDKTAGTMAEQLLEKAVPLIWSS